MGHKLFFDFAGVGARDIDFVDGDDDRGPRRFGVADGFDGLRHDAIIGSDDQNDDVGDVGASCAHFGKGRVPWGIDESDLLAMDFLLIGADGLGDAARFPFGDVRRADGVD